MNKKKQLKNAQIARLLTFFAFVFMIIETINPFLLPTLPNSLAVLLIFVFIWIPKFYCLHLFKDVPTYKTGNWSSPTPNGASVVSKWAMYLLALAIITVILPMPILIKDNPAVQVIYGLCAFVILLIMFMQKWEIDSWKVEFAKEINS